MDKYAYSITRPRANDIVYPFIPTPRPLQRRYPTTNLGIVMAAVVTICIVDELDVRLCVQNQDAVAARLLRTRPASSIQGISTHTRTGTCAPRPFVGPTSRYLVGCTHHLATSLCMCSFVFVCLWTRAGATAATAKYINRLCIERQPADQCVDRRTQVQSSSCYYWWCRLVMLVMQLIGH